MNYQTINSDITRDFSAIALGPNFGPIPNDNYPVFIVPCPPQSGAGDMEMLGIRPLVRPSEICCKCSKIFIC